MLKYNNDIKGFLIVISAILSWQYPGSIGQHRETLQTIFRLYPTTSVFNISIHSILVTHKHEYLLQNQICSDVFFSLQVYVQGTGMGGYDVKSIDNDKNQIGIILIKWFFLSQLPRSV